MRRTVTATGAAIALLLAPAARAQDRATGDEDGGSGRDAVAIDATARDAVATDRAIGDVRRLDASGVDTRWDAGISGPCGALTFQGACHGSVNIWCDRDSGTVAANECASGGSGVSCGLVDCPDSDCYGYGCVAPLAGLCDGQYIFCDVTLGQGCVEGVCAAAGACEPDSYVRTCSGNVLSFCPTGRVWRRDCSADATAPYVCATGSAGSACLGTAGGGCNLTHTPPFECASGFVCSSSDGAGLCVAPVDGGSQAESGQVRPDAGGGSADGASGDGDSTSDCGCRGATPVAPALAIALLLLGLARIRRHA